MLGSQNPEEDLWEIKRRWGENPQQEEPQQEEAGAAPKKNPSSLIINLINRSQQTKKESK